MKHTILLLSLTLSFVPFFAQARHLFIAADGDDAWTKVIESHTSGTKPHVYSFGTNSIAQTLASARWKEFLADLASHPGVALVALGRNGMTPDLTRALVDVNRTHSYIGAVPPWSPDAKAFARDRGLLRKYITGACGYCVPLFQEVLPEADTPEEYAGALMTDAYMFLYAIQRCRGLDMKWFNGEVKRRYAKIRQNGVRPVKPGELRLTPTFVSCGVDFGSAEELKDADLFVDGRSYPFPYFDAFGEHRGSVLRLKEDTEYTVEIRSAGKTVKTGTFRTWKSAVPVAKTVEIDPQAAKFPIVIDRGGTPDGWIRYVTKGGAPLVNTTRRPTLEVVKGAAYVIIDGITFRGGNDAHVIALKKSQYVRIVNCEMSGWGRASKADYTRTGQYWTADGVWVNFDGAIDVGPGCVGTVIERCWIHDPISRANGWFYAHPAGPEAVTVCYPEHSTVIRWCDFTGSDDKMWNDAVEGAGNFVDDGGFNRDADVYGNFMIASNDDSIELDGGMRNVRCFDNRFENSGCGVSIQGCMVSPVYVFDNLFTGLGAEHGIIMQTIKTSSYDRRCNGSWSWIAGNTMWGDGTGLQLQFAGGFERYNVIGNRFCGEMQKLTGTSAVAFANGLIMDNTFNVEIGEKDLDTTYPKRPLAFVLDRARFSGVTLKNGVLSENDLAFSAIHDGKGADVAFRVVQNEVHDWFAVTPSEGVIAKGAKVPFKIRLDPKKMTSRRHYRGSFLVRTPEGLSRPVSLNVDTDYEQALRPEIPKGAFAAYMIFDKPVVANRDAFPKRDFTFDIPKDGKYSFVFRLHRPGQTLDGPSKNPPRVFAGISAKLDGTQGIGCGCGVTDYPAWYHGGGMHLRPIDLKAGRHTLTVWSDDKVGEKNLICGGVAVTDALGAFEPR